MGENKKMRSLTIALSSTLLMTLPVSSFADQTGGRYATHNSHEVTQEMPDGTKVVVSHYTQITFADDSSHPLDNVSSDCVGRFHATADDAFISADGMCTSFNAAGDTASFWWRADEANTADCPDLCGSWGYFNGTGKFDGIEGSGSWIRNTLFHNGSSGTWKGAAKLK
jgi:hypothetical protein